MLLAHDGVDLGYDECIGVTYDDVRHDPEGALARIVERYKAVEAQCDAVVIVGSDYTDVGSPAELGYNARIAANLGAPVLLVLSGRAGAGGAARRLEPRTPEQMGQIASLALSELAHARASLFAVIANRTEPGELDEVIASLEGVLAAARPGGAGRRRRPGVGAAGGPIPHRSVGPGNPALRRRPSGQGRPRPAHARGSGRRGRGHVDGQRPSPPDRERDRRHSGRPHRGAAGDHAGQRVRNLPVGFGRRAERSVPAARDDRPADRRAGLLAADHRDRPRHLRHDGADHEHARAPGRGLARADTTPHWGCSSATSTPRS